MMVNLNLTVNCIFQYINQGCHITYNSWQLVKFTPSAELVFRSEFSGLGMGAAGVSVGSLSKSTKAGTSAAWT
jgi:hypothetical protein